jgi:predicted aspartyl protease
MAKHNRRGKTAPVAAAVPIDPIASVMPDMGRSDEGDSLSLDEVSKPLPDIPTCKPLVWHCTADDRQSEFFHPTFMTALIDDGSHLVMVTPKIANKLSLKCRKLAKPLKFSLAINDKSTRMNNTDPKDNCTHPPDHRELTECVKLKLYDRTRQWTSRTVWAVIAPDLCVDILLGLPWLERNKIVIDHELRTVINKETGFDLLSIPPKKPVLCPRPKKKLREQYEEIMNH